MPWLTNYINFDRSPWEWITLCRDCYSHRPLTVSAIEVHGKPLIECRLCGQRSEDTSTGYYHHKRKETHDTTEDPLLGT